MHIHRRLYRLAMDVHGFFPAIATISLLTAIIIITQMHLLSLIISAVFENNSLSQTELLLYLLLAILIRSLLIWLRERIAQQNAVKVKSLLRRQLYTKILSLGPGFSRAGKTGDTIASLTEGVEKLDDYYTRYIPSIIHIVILPLTIIVFTLFTDWPSGLIMLITAPLILFFMWMIGTYAKKLTQSQWGAMSRLSSHFLDVLQGLKTLKTFNAGEREIKRVDKSSDLFRLLTLKVLKVAFLSGMVLELAASVSIAMVAVQIGIRLIEGMMDYQPGLFILLLAPEFYLPFRTLGAHHHAGMEGAAAASGIFTILDVPEQDQPEYGKTILAPFSPNVVFKEVSYRYPGADQLALDKISCQIAPGSFTAIVGHTGAGKSTFAQLLLGFLQPVQGSILINDITLSEIGSDRWREKVAFVPQHPHFFNGTILDNLLTARSEASLEEIETATKLAGAHGFIQALPQGYNTMITENASRLSGGEKQRLAIARAFLKDAPLLILDEPTSSLDPESEQIIADATQKLIQNRSTLIIAHRLQTVQNADRILVFHEGTIAESGTHLQLVSQNGIYAGYLQTLSSTSNP